MAKNKTTFVCQQCGASYQKWSGRCDNCGEWNSLVEQMSADLGTKTLTRSMDKGRGLTTFGLSESKIQNEADRISSGISDLDAVLGGGLLPGGVVLLAGQPGIGKSTLLTQIVANTGNDNSVLYVSGEESVSQISSRVARLTKAKAGNLQLVSSNKAEDIAVTIMSGKYKLVVVDSVQTLSLTEISSAPGSVSQITNSSNILIRSAKETSTALILVGHVTKEGSIAGPKVLEHLVDVVLNFEGDRYGGFRTVRAQKNRYGSTSEMAIFEMFDDGLRIVSNPSASLLAERQSSDGSIVLATVEGNRPLLVEIQALVNETNFGYPKRTASGFDLNRLNLLIAVLEKRTKLKLSDKDIYVNVVGGLRIDDPSADLAVAMAIASASAGRNLGDDAVVFGEIGLGGEVRSSSSWGQRVKEAKKLGFKFAIAPSFHKDPFIRGVSNVRQALVDYLQ